MLPVKLIETEKIIPANNKKRQKSLYKHFGNMSVLNKIDLETGFNV